MTESEWRSSSGGTATTEVIESRVKHASTFLDSIDAIFSASKPLKTGEWLNRIAQAKQSLSSSQTVIGFIGATGTGKSTLLNAILDEDSILPTSCTRACTSVVIEIRYNTSETRYQAEIEFLTKEEWESELSVLLRTISDDDGNFSENCSDESTDEGRAFSKLQAIYPDVSSVPPSSLSISDLCTPELASYLSKTIKVQDDDPEIFHDKVREYTTPNILSAKGNNDNSIKFMVWPLIRVVRIYLKSSVLKHGAILVDLPGVHDDNAARVAVTESYIRDCSAIFVVTPIIRAVDDRSATKLLDNALKQQIQLDGNIGNIAVICTKTDLIEANEVDRDLDLRSYTKPAQLEIEKLQQALQQTDARLKQLKKDAKHAKKSLHQEEYDFQVFRGERESTRPGQLIDCEAATDTPRKRRFTEISALPPCDREPTELYDMVWAQSDRHEDREHAKRKRPIHDLYWKIQGDITRIEEESEELAQQLFEKEKTLNNLRIIARNGNCKMAMKQRFANEIRTSDRDSGNGLGDGRQSDYQILAKNLDVFCVSSNAYQKLKDRNHEGIRTNGFIQDADTEIPQVRSHCQEVAMKLRTFYQLRFLNEVALLLNSLKLWVLSNTGQEEHQVHAVDIHKISEGLVIASNEAASAAKMIIDDKICTMFPQIVLEAKNEAATIATRWSSGAAGSLHWTTYTAVVKNAGSFNSSTKGRINFDQDLADSLLRRLLPYWEDVFSYRLPSLIQRTLENFQGQVELFLTQVDAAGTRYNIDPKTIDLLKKQAHNYSTKLAHTLRLAEIEIRTQQRMASRQLTPLIHSHMRSVYMNCAQQTGNGKFQRMKDIMKAGVYLKRSLMYRESVDLVRTKLDRIVDDIARDLLGKVNEICTSIGQDCMALQAQIQERITDEQRPLKEQITFWVDLYDVNISPRQLHEFVDLDDINEEDLNKSLNEQARLRATTKPSVKQEHEE